MEGTMRAKKELNDEGGIHTREREPHMSMEGMERMLSEQRES